MKKKCMAAGGTAKKPATMNEQLSGLRGKVRPGYQAGGTVYRSGNSFSDQLIGEPMKGVASAGMSGQVDSMLDRTKAMPGSIASSPLSYVGSLIPNQTGAQVMRSATSFGMPPAGTAPTANSQTISTGDYSTGPRQGGFVNEGGTPRTTPAQDAAAEAAARQAEIAARSKQQIDEIAGMKGLSDRQRVAAVSGVALNAGQSGVGTNIASALGTPMNQLSNKQQLRVSQAQYGVDMQEDGLTPPARRGNRQGYADGGMTKKTTYFGDRPPPKSALEDNEPPRPIPPRIPPIVPTRPIAMPPQPVKVPLPPPEYPQERQRPVAPQSTDAPPGAYQGVTGVADEIRKRKVKNAEAADYAAGGMVRFSGKGGPRDDQIPVKVAGQEINVSDGENAVILPAKTAANSAALQAIGGIIQATNDGRKPRMGIEKGGKYQVGAVDDSMFPEGGYLRTPEGRQRVKDAIVNAPAIGGPVSFGGPPAPTAQSMYAPAAEAIKQGLSGQGMRPDMGIIGPRPAPVAAPAQVPSPIVAAHNQIMNSGNAAGKIALPITQEQKQSAMQNTAAARAAAPVNQESGATQRDGMTTTQMGRGFDPTQLKMADGYGMASNSSGKTIAAGPSEYVGADGLPTSKWTDTQAYKDAIARNERDKLRLAEMQAQRLGINPQAAQAASQGIAGAILGNKVKEDDLQRQDDIRSFVARAAAETDPEKQKQYLDSAMALQGKPNKRGGNFKVVDLGGTAVDNGMGGKVIVPGGQAVFDEDTKGFIPAGASATVGDSKAPTPKEYSSEAEVIAARKAGKIKDGDRVVIKGKQFDWKD